MDKANISLPIEQHAVYNDVNGLSLQNLFYSRNGYFPNCFMYITNDPSGYFDIDALKKYVEKKLDERYTAPEIIETLRTMDMKLENETSYIPNYIRTDLTDALHDKFGFRTDFEVVSEKNIKKILRQTKK